MCLFVVLCVAMLLGLIDCLLVFVVVLVRLLALFVAWVFLRNVVYLSACLAVQLCVSLFACLCICVRIRLIASLFFVCVCACLLV